MAEPGLSTVGAEEAIPPGEIEAKVAVGLVELDGVEDLVLSKLTVIPSSFPRFASSGVWGDPRKANSRNGRIMLDKVSRKLTSTIKDIEKTYGTIFKGKK